jgi:hypothetical protein
MLQVISSSACQLEPLFKGHTGANYSSLPGQVPADRPLVALGAGKLIKLPPDNGRRYRRPRAEEVVLRFAFKRALLNANEQSNLRYSDVNKAVGGGTLCFSPDVIFWTSLIGRCN